MKKKKKKKGEVSKKKKKNIKKKKIKINKGVGKTNIIYQFVEGKFIGGFFFFFLF